MLFLLIHGSWHGGWCWERLLPLLEGDVLAIDMPGWQSHGPNRLDEVGLSDWRDAVVHAAISSGHQKIVLVAHSIGALALPPAAAILGDRLHHVVAIAGVIPAEGRCGADMFLPWSPISIGPLVAPSPKGTLPSRRLLRYWLCQDLDLDTASWLLAQLRPSPSRPALTRMSWRGFRWPCPLSYIATTRDRAVPPAAQRRVIAQLPSARVYSIDSGHEAMIARPQQIATIINMIK